MRKMRSGTKRLTTCAILSALGVVLLYLAALLPTSRLALIAVAGFLPALAVMAYGLGWGLVSFAVTAVLALLLLPVKDAAAVYCLFFGHYPVVKSLIERLDRLWLEWVLKLLWFNLLLTAGWFLLRTVLFQVLPVQSLAAAILYILGNAVFIIYDVCFTGLIRGADRIVKKIR